MSAQQKLNENLWKNRLQDFLIILLKLAILTIFINFVVLKALNVTLFIFINSEYDFVDTTTLIMGWMCITFIIYFILRFENMMGFYDNQLIKYD